MSLQAGVYEQLHQSYILKSKKNKKLPWSIYIDRNAVATTLTIIKKITGPTLGALEKSCLYISNEGVKSLTTFQIVIMVI
ncbi:hypothetical protein UB34_14330 [Photobacterium leiognathi]|nr:hypothetical protein UB34_14330 [Photobacterium leiognathi]